MMTREDLASSLNALKDDPLAWHALVTIQTREVVLDIRDLLMGTQNLDKFRKELEHLMYLATQDYDMTVGPKQRLEAVIEYINLIKANDRTTKNN